MEPERESLTCPTPGRQGLSLVPPISADRQASQPRSTTLATAPGQASARSVEPCHVTVTQAASQPRGLQNSLAERGSGGTRTCMLPDLISSLSSTQSNRLPLAAGEASTLSLRREGNPLTWLAVHGSAVQCMGVCIPCVY